MLENRKIEIQKLFKRIFIQNKRFEFALQFFLFQKCKIAWMTLDCDRHSP